MALGERCCKRSDVRKSATVLSLIFFLLTLGWPIYDRTVPESARETRLDPVPTDRATQEESGLQNK